MESYKSNETTELKNFMTTLRSGTLLNLIESNQIHFQEKYNTICIKAKQSGEEITRQLLILQQNSHLIEKFQNQLQELSIQNSELLDQQQTLKEENDNLKNQLQCSEDKFAELDIVYDQQISASSIRISELETLLANIENAQNKYIDEFNQTQIELQEKLTKTEQFNADLQNRLEQLADQLEDKQKAYQSEFDKANQINKMLTQTLISHEEKIKDLQNNLAVALTENEEIDVLKNEIEKLNNDRGAEQNEYRKETIRLMALNEDLKLAAEDLKKKLSSKEKETEEVYLKLKQVTKFGNKLPENPPSIQSSKYLNRKRPSTDGANTIYNTSDSDGSAISFYKLRKGRQISTETDDESVFNGIQNRPGNLLNSRPVIGFKNHSKINGGSPYQRHIEIPESPVVSSSAFGNPDQKL